MITLTKEWLQKTIAELEEERDATPGAVNEDAANALAAMKLALASLEAEAVCVIDQSNLDYLKSGSDADVWPASRAEMGDVLLYRSATPAPVSVPAAMEMDDDFDSAFEHGKAVGWNACRAAMLQGAVGNSPVIPDGLRLALSNAGIAAPESDEMLAATCEKYIQALVTWVKERKPFRSAVIPDGWVACSEQMPEDEQEVIVQNKMGYRYVSYFDEHSGLFFDMRGGNQMNCIEHIFVTHWMPLPAAPQQEA